MPFRREFDARFILRLQKQAIPIGISLIVTNAYLHVDTLILTALAGFAEVGWYNAALKVYMAMMIFPAIVANVLLPRLSRSFVGDSKREHNRMLVLGVGGILIISLPMAAVGALGAPWFMPLVFGPDFEASVQPMQVLFLATVVSFQVWLARTILVAVDRLKAMIWLALAGLVIRVVLDLTLIPRLGVTGAAIAAGISELAMLIGVWGYLIAYHFRVRTPGDVVERLRATLRSSLLDQRPEI